MAQSEDVLLQVPYVKHKKDDGTLYLMSERLAWIQGNKDTVTLSHRYVDIKSQKISSEGKPKIQLQVVLHNNATYTFHFVHPEGPRAQFESRNQVKELLLQLLPKFRRKTDKELEVKSRILSDNPALLQLYKDLVTDGIVSAEEFWSVHATQYVANKKPTQAQDVGVESGFLSGIQPQTDGNNGLKYNITTDVIESIFKTYPAVRKKHAECVPGQMSESQFWIKFFQSHYFHRDRMPVIKDMFSDCAKADDKEMRRELEKVKESHSKVVSVLEHENETAIPLENEPPETGSKKDKQPIATGVLKTMIKRFNQHSIMVLKACERNKQQDQSAEVNGDNLDGTVQAPVAAAAPPEKKAKLDLENSEFIEYEDLESRASETFKNLNLAGVDRYLNGPVGDYQTDPVSQEILLQSVHTLRAYADRWAMKPQLMDAKTAGQILSELSPGGALMKVSHREGTIQALPPELETEMRNLYLSLGELLRHFWACFPPTTPALQEKLKKMHETLKKFEQVKFRQLKDRLLQNHLNAEPILRHVTAMLSQADGKYTTWCQRTQKLK